jgi:DNA-binding transcriptional regulator GbsR (MarR family)
LINDQYELTRQGKEIFESLMMIEDATKIYYRLNSVDILEGVGEEEIFKLIDRMKFNKGLKQLIIQCRSVFNIGQT